MRAFLYAAVCGLSLAAPAPADDKAKPHMPTPKEIADGWIMLFDGETTFGWKTDGAAEVKDGVLILGGNGKAASATPTAQFRDYDVVIESEGKGGVWFHDESGKVGTGLQAGRTEVKARVVPGSGTTIADNGKKPTQNVEMMSSRRKEFRLEVSEGATMRVRSVKLRPVTAVTLFDGKSLDGWKVNMADPKRTASKFEVTKDGELSVKNGPGDLVTEKEFDNFVLQFECKTLGDGLNSGFFFRCIPGQYQNGYEAQVQNAYVDGDRTKPKDFGTGAIYRRIAARKVVSNDREWFTMTVLADGKHIATWVNGYQTVDWTDDRKENENPRQGFRAAKGPISIQGHDPTTDLLFRNIRVGELTK
jgi:hypothetical protein